MDGIQIHYQGFSPSQLTQDSIRQLMQRLYDEAPSMSTLRVTITRVGDDAFKGILRISSNAGPFFSVASGSQLTDVAHQLLERTRRQLDKWKSRRFMRKNGRRSKENPTRLSWNPSSRRDNYDEQKRLNERTPGA